MSYQRMEEGAVPGYRDRSTGPVTTYSTSAGGTTSRALNRTECHNRLQTILDSHEKQVDKVTEKTARKLLSLLRKLVKPFNTSRHEIRIIYSMGSTLVQVGSKHISDYHRPSPLIDLLQEIDQMLDGSEFSAYLAGELLNQPVKP